MRIGHGRCPWCTAECRRSGRAFGIRVTRKGSHRKGCFSSAVLLGSVEHPDTVRGLNKGQGFIQKQQALYKDDPGFRTDERSHKTDSDSKSGNTTCLFIGGMSLPIERRTYGELIAAILKKCFFPLHEFRSENAAPEVIAIPVCLEVLIVFVMPSVPLKDDLKSMPYRKHENSASSSCCPEDKSKNIENTETRKKRKPEGLGGLGHNFFYVTHFCCAPQEEGTGGFGGQTQRSCSLEQHSQVLGQFSRSYPYSKTLLNADIS
ncbi:hypothetical protein MG293_017088 [Ovis ammon polii]|uniref:Uncharacterized protein n=1 Tax=Ovis ammon polii TaxID=230172 RepID=A0AAD4TUQ8_OVIAM|nr:hypothetical protein MG293_017088 [Ovis ammon polii]